MKIIVTAGGQGTKVWPYSRGDKPKQFQPIIGDTSTYEDTITILLRKFTPEDIFISTKRKFIKYVSEQSPQIPLKNYIIEPDVAKDRGPAEGLAFVKLSVQHPGELFFMVQADCVRKPEEAFLQMIEDAEKIVTQNKKLLTGGMKATEPNMGVDYLKLGEHVASGTKQDVYAVDSFVNRSSTYRETKQLIENYHVVTHPQHYCWYPEFMLEAYRKYRPDWYDALMEIKAGIDKPGEDALIEKVYQTMEKGATEEVTREVMNSGDAQVILLPFKWTDIGTWGSVYDFFVDGDGRGNYEDGRVLALETSGSLIKTDDEHKLIAVAGVEDLVIVDTDDVLLIVPKNKIEKIKEIQAQLAERGEDEFL
ncbi:MAG TPA: sugar phosphate nucleotidyltransferase [Candidatus Saccharimonadales bacterium]|nr:sugar phosphate nucleotidyltransferase [Candidatus Saccharimonadales bacterium]